jgi:hypothetical protein
VTNSTKLQRMCLIKKPVVAYDIESSMWQDAQSCQIHSLFEYKPISATFVTRMDIMPSCRNLRGRKLPQVTDYGPGHSKDKAFHHLLSADDVPLNSRPVKCLAKSHLCT